MNRRYINIGGLFHFAVAALSLLASSCSSDPTDDFRYVAPGWEDGLGYTIEEVANGELDTTAGTRWTILDSELSTSDSNYDAFKAAINSYEGVELNFANAESVASSYFHGFESVVAIQMEKATYFGISAFSGLPLTSLSLTADDSFSGPDGFGMVFSEFTNSESCDLVLGAAEFDNVNVAAGEWGGKRWKSITDTNGLTILSEPTERVPYTISEMKFNTEYSLNEIWEFADSDISVEDFQKLVHVINYQGTGVVWISLPNIAEIPATAFDGCSGLYSVELMDGATLGEGAFASCSALARIKNLERVAALSVRSFYKCTSLLSVDISGVVSLPDELFRGCSALTDVTLSDSSEVAVGSYVFQDCVSLATITNLESVTSFGTSVFKSCIALRSLEIYAAALSGFMFIDCENLESLTLPNCTALGNGSFSGCASLTELKLLSDSAISLHIKALKSIDTTKCTLTLGDTEAQNLTTTGEWGGAVWAKILDTEGNEIVVAEPEESNVSQDAIVLAELTGGETFNTTDPWVITDAGELAKDTPGMTTLYALINAAGEGAVDLRLPNITAIGECGNVEGEMFHSCTGLKSVTLNESGVTVGTYAFRACSNLSQIVNLDKVTEFGETVFFSCTSLTDVTLSVATIPTALFNGCSGLTSITLTNSGEMTVGNNWVKGVDTANCDLTLGAAEYATVDTATNVWRKSTWKSISLMK